MAKFLPVVGEAATIFESGVKLVAAGAVAPFNPEAGQQLLDSAGEAWVNYSQESVVMCTIRGDGAGMVRGADAFSKGFPVIAHIRGAVHLARGEPTEACDCIVNGTKAIGIIGAAAAVTLATGGLGTVAACATVGVSAAGSQVALDAVDSVSRGSTVGTIAGAKLAYDTGNAVHIADAIIAPAQTATMAAYGAAIGRGYAAKALAAELAAEQNLVGSGQRLVAPQGRPNPALTPAALEQLPPLPANHPVRLPRSAPANPPPSAPAAPKTSSATTTGTSASAVASAAATSSTTPASEYSVRSSCLSDVHDAPPVPLGSRVPIDARLNPGKYKYVIQKDGAGGKIVRLQRFTVSDRCHADCAGGVNAKVIHAGEVELVAQGTGLAVQRFNSCSGHFKPTPFDLATPLFQGGSEAYTRVVQPFMEHFFVNRNVQYLGMQDM